MGEAVGFPGFSATAGQEAVGLTDSTSQGVLELYLRAILIELRILNMMTQANGAFIPEDLDTLRADPSLIGEIGGNIS